MSKIHKVLAIDLNKPAPDVDRLIGGVVDLNQPIVKKTKIDENSVKLDEHVYGKEQGKNGSIIDRVKTLGAMHGVDLISLNPHR